MKLLALVGNFGWVGARGLCLGSVATVACVVGLSLPSARAAEGLYITEVIADNRSTPPSDVSGNSPDMIEIYNDSEEEIVLGGALSEDTFYLSDTVEFSVEPPDPQNSSFWRFPPATVIPPKTYLVIFCDGDMDEAFCELHASFQLDSSGTEPVSLWGPQQDGVRPLLDQFWLPPLSPDVAFGRPPPPDLGPRPVPLEETLDILRFFPPGGATFGVCEEDEEGRVCFPGGIRESARTCHGADNGPAGNLPPRVEREEYSTSHPATGEDVFLTVTVRDDKLRPGDTPDDVKAKVPDVDLVYRIDGGEWISLPMEYDFETGVQTGAGENRPLRIWTVWDGTIPGQPAGVQVEFYFRVRDPEQAADPDVWSTSPQELCPEGIGPCDREFGGPDCELDPEDRTCNDELVGERYVACSKPFTYVVGYVPAGNLGSVVINEVVPNQRGLLMDATQGPCASGETNCEPDNEGNVPGCCEEDFIEIHNTSAEAVDISGLWLSEKPFRPQLGWSFPPGSILPPGAYCVVWLDSDGGKCPDPNVSILEQPCFWECPDPNNASTPIREWHTNFSLNAAGDEIFLFDTEENRFGVIHGVDFEDLEKFGVTADSLGNLRFPVNHSLSLLPDGDRNGCWALTENPTVGGAPDGCRGRPNQGTCSNFKRGDSNDDCNVDLSDGVHILNWLFMGGRLPNCLDAADTDDNGAVNLSDAVIVFNYLFLGGEPPLDPGPELPGEDPTDDDLPTCRAEACRAQ